MAEPERAQLVTILSDHFSVGELRQLCFEMAIEYSDLEGATRKEKIIALIAYTDRHGLLLQLINYVQRNRPHVSWQTGDSLENNTLPVSPSPEKSSGIQNGITIGGNVGAGAVVGNGQVQAENIAGRDINIFHGLISRWGLPLLLLIAVVVVTTLILVAQNGSANHLQTGTVSSSGNSPPTLTPPAATPSSTPSPTPSPTPLPALQVMSDPLLQGRRIRDVSAADGHLWLATTSGLVHVNSTTGKVQNITAVSDKLEAVVAAPDAAEVWFSTSSGGIGRYQLATSQVDRFVGPSAVSLITALALLPEGVLWLGDLNGTIWQLASNANPGSEWQPIAIPSTLPPIISVVAFAVAPTALPTVWLVGADAVYRWQDNIWKSFDYEDGLPLVINAVAADASGRVWLGHGTGLTFFRHEVGSQIIRACAVDSASLSNVVLDLATTADGNALWVVTRAELARLTISPQAEAGGCTDAANWQRWSEFGFWRGDIASQYRLTIDANAADQLTVWVVRRDSDQVRRLDWR